MSRALTLVPLLTLALVAVTSGETASPRPVIATAVTTVVPEPAPSVDPLVEALGREPAIHIHRAARDVMHHSLDNLRNFLDSLGTQGNFQVPDLSVLRVDPTHDNDPTSSFGWRQDPIRHSAKFHSGTDFRGKRGTPVYAAGDGVVKYCGTQNGYGNMIDVDHGGGVVTRYAHLQRFKTKKDAALQAGDLIGLVGATGRVTGPHLHFEVRLDGHAVDPLTVMAIAELQRESPTAGRIAAQTLAPELQSKKQSEIDPPKTKAKKKESRPERRGREKRVRPVS